MNWPLFWQLLISAVVAFLAAWLGHRLSAKRDAANKRREQRTNFLIDAYRRIERSANRASEYDPKDLESATADIQLFGTPKQIELVQRFIAEFASEQSASTDDLLAELRRDLRRELAFEPATDSLKFFRIVPGPRRR